MKRTAPLVPEVPDPRGEARDARFYLGTAGLMVALAIGILLAVGLGSWVVLLFLIFLVFLGLGVAAFRRQSK